MTANEHENLTYWAFISYTHADRKWAAWLHRNLERYRIPKRLVGKPIPPWQEPAPKRFFPVCLDRTDMAASPSVDDEVHRDLSRSRWLIVVCSPDAAEAGWVDKEIRSFRAQGQETETRILSLIVAGDPRAKNGKQCFPSVLREHPPLAADVRPGQDGKTNAMLKLLAGMLDVPFDELRQRESHRKIRHLQITLACALSLLMGVATLACYANRQRIAAVTAQGQTVEHVEYLLYDLTQKLQPLGKIDILESVIDKAMSFAERTPDNANTRYLKAAAYLNQGEIALTSGRTQAAKEAFTQAVSLRQTLLRHNPSSATYRIAYAEALAHIGRVDMACGYSSRALSNQLASVNLITNTFSETSVDQISKAAFACSAAADTLRKTGRLREARPLQLMCVDLLRSACQRLPNDADMNRQLATSVDRLGDIMLRINLDEARKHYETALQLRQWLLKSVPDDLLLMEDLSRSWESFAAWNAGRGNTQESLDYYLKAAAIRQYLTGQEPRNTIWQSLLAKTQGYLSARYSAMGMLNQAFSNSCESARIFSQLEASDPQNTNWREGKIMALEALGDLHKARGQPSLAAGMEKALSYYREARSSREDLREQDPHNRSWLLGLSVSDIRLGDWYSANKELDKAVMSYTAALSVREFFVTEEPANPVNLSMLTTAFSKLSLAHQARQEWQKAVDYALQSLEVANRQLALDRQCASGLVDCARTHYRLGNLFREMPNSTPDKAEKSRQHLSEARDLFIKLKEERGLLDLSHDRFLARINSMLEQSN